MEYDGPIFESVEVQRQKELDASTRFMLRGPRMTASLIGGFVEFDGAPVSILGKAIGFVATYGLIYYVAGKIIREMDHWPE
jgi:hypothetical protein